jgi:hypothetical protein
MRQRVLLRVVIAALCSGPAAMTVAAHGASETCAVTAPNHDTPPDAVLARANIYRATGARTSDDNLIGNGRIWTTLWPNETVAFRKGGPGFVLPDGSLKMKFLWLLAGDGPLTISGRRLDATAPPLKADISPNFTGAGFQPSALIFPTAGCWEVTARANGSTLTFVTAVTREGF